MPTASPRGRHQSREAAQAGGAAVKGALYCLVAGVAWGAQFPIAGSVLKLIDPFYFTLLRYLTVSLILVTVLIIAEGTKALSCEGKAKWVWLFGSMPFTVYNFLVFLGQKTAGPSGAVLASIMMALMPIISVLVMCVYKKTTPSKFTLGCILVAFLGVSLVITKGDISLLSSTSGNLIPALLILTEDGGPDWGIPSGHKKSQPAAPSFTRQAVDIWLSFWFFDHRRRGDRRELTTIRLAGSTTETMGMN